MRLSTYIAASPAIVDGASGRAKRVIMATRTAQTRVVDDRAWDYLTQGTFDLLPLSLLYEMIDIEAVVPDDEDELATIIRRNSVAISAASLLYLVVQPTASCQLGCDYCGQEHSARLLSTEDQDAFVERTRRKLRSGAYTEFEIGWFGAEPLLGLSVIRRMTPSLMDLARECGARYAAKVVTNGLSLSKRVAAELVNDLGVRFIEVTLDGSADSHDARRHTKRGGATFDRILANVLQVARSGLPVTLNLRCNVDRRNADGVADLVRLLAEANVQDQISLYFAPIHSWGNDAHLKSLSRAEFAAWEMERYAEMVLLGFTPSLLPTRKPTVCLAVMPEGELVDAYGDIYNCTEVSYVPAYGSPNVYRIDSLGNGGKNPQGRNRPVADTDRATGSAPRTVAVTIGPRPNAANEKRPTHPHPGLELRDFNGRIAEGRYDCHECRMLPVCGGSCPKQWAEGLAPCPPAKYDIEDRLLLAYAQSRIASAK